MSKIIQIAAIPVGTSEAGKLYNKTTLFALTADGTVWMLDASAGWNRVIAIPGLTNQPDPDPLASLRGGVCDCGGHDPKHCTTISTGAPGQVFDQGTMRWVDPDPMQDGPACPSCGVPWVSHKGMMLTCAENQSLKQQLHTLQDEHDSDAKRLNRKLIHYGGHRDDCGCKYGGKCNCMWDKTRGMAISAIKSGGKA